MYILRENQDVALNQLMRTGPSPLPPCGLPSVCLFQKSMLLPKSQEGHTLLSKSVKLQLDDCEELRQRYQYQKKKEGGSAVSQCQKLGTGQGTVIICDTVKRAHTVIGTHKRERRPKKGTTSSCTS